VPGAGSRGPLELVVLALGMAWPLRRLIRRGPRA
jgi:hypothetical protein